MAEVAEDRRDRLDGEEAAAVDGDAAAGSGSVLDGAGDAGGAAGGGGAGEEGDGTGSSASGPAEEEGAAEEEEGTAPRKRGSVPRGPSGGGRKKKNSVVVKVGMVGDAQVGKTSLMVKYVEGKFDEDYIQTLGVNFMEKTINIRSTEITFSIWDLGGQREFISMLPLVCNDAVAILFMFDLSRRSTLNSIKEWYRQARGLNKTAYPFLIGTKYDYFAGFAPEDQRDITKQAMKFAKAMKAPLIFTSASHSVNVQKIFKLVLSKVFDLRCTIPKVLRIGDPILLY
eukprot:PLAT12581.1.p1 GENE.PLAT12581.1~~PLAT12581.1.p1  ORF type:complete len:296 (+),score=108.17 PLAT12581.1:37-888(+)